MSTLFVSYSRKDSEFVRKLLELPRDVHIEDVKEFLPVLPRRMLWRLFALRRRHAEEMAKHEEVAEFDGLDWEGRLFKYVTIFSLRPPSPYIIGLAVLIVQIVKLSRWARSMSVELDVPEGRVWAEVYSGPDVYVVHVLVIGGTVLVYVLVMAWLRNVFFRHVIGSLFNWCGHRPLSATENPLLKTWPRVKPIFWELLDRPLAQWRPYIAAKVRDPVLRRAVESTGIVIAGVPG